MPDSSPVLIECTDKVSPSGSVSLLNTPFEAFFVPVAPASIARVSAFGSGGSLLPVTVAYLAGFKNNQNPLQRTVSFCSGIVFSLVILGSLSGLLGKI